jgi:hypothetical protein
MRFVGMISSAFKPTRDYPPRIAMLQPYLQSQSLDQEPEDPEDREDPEIH